MQPWSAILTHSLAGTMHNKVVYHAMKAFQSFGLPVLRFNFRGAGLSEGTHDHGHGEVSDLRAALDWLQREYERPILFAGFSFGASVGLRACCGDERVKGIAALGLPVRAGGRDYHYNFLAGCRQPKLFVSGMADEYGPRTEIEAVVAGSREPGHAGAGARRRSFLRRQAGADAAGAERLDRNSLHARGDGEMTTAASETKRRELHDEARRIFHHALRASSIPAAFDRRLRFEGQSLFHASLAGGDEVCIPLAHYDRIHAVALGKAALPMLETLRARLPGGLAGGVCCAPSLPAEPAPGVAYYAGGHPLPNQDSFASACVALQLLRGTSARDFVFFLISGGGSAMFELPLDPGISLDETRTLYQALVGSGATIAEINTVRKHFSAVKGGRLAAAAPQAARFSLLVSDVAPRYLDALASGPTLPDSSTVAECREIIHRYRLAEALPTGRTGLLR